MSAQSSAFKWWHQNADFSTQSGLKGAKQTYLHQLHLCERLWDSRSISKTSISLWITFNSIADNEDSGSPVRSWHLGQIILRSEMNLMMLLKKNSYDFETSRIARNECYKWKLPLIRIADHWWTAQMEDQKKSILQKFIIIIRLPNQKMQWWISEFFPFG